MMYLHKSPHALAFSRSLTTNAKPVRKELRMESRKNLAGNAFIKYGSRLTFCRYSDLHDLGSGVLKCPT